MTTNTHADRRYRTASGSFSKRRTGRRLTASLSVLLIATLVASGLNPASASASASVSGAAPQQSAAIAAAAEPTLLRPQSGFYNVRGQGSGHGRGMSQYGAKGAADQGKRAGAILDFYYPNTVRRTVSASTKIRVWISYGQGPAGSPRSTVDDAPVVKKVSGLVVTNVATGKRITIPASATAVRATVSGPGFLVAAKVGSTWKKAATTSGSVKFSGVTAPTLVFGSETRSYRGVISAVRIGTGAMTVNTLLLEDYLKSVVPREMPSSWPHESLRVQSVAARTYAMANLNSARSWDICDTTYCQVYGGTSYAGGEATSSNAAIAATAGIIQTYGGGPINAQFGASSGGYTVDGGTPYLLARNDPWDRAGIAGRGAVWEEQLSVQTIESAYPSIGTFRGLRIESRDGRGAFGGRVLNVRLFGSAGEILVTGNNIRQIGGFESNLFEFVTEDATRNPQGSVDGMTRTATGVNIRGWALDPDGPQTPLSVLVTVKSADLTVQYKFSANLTRTDVAAAFPGYGSGHGFNRSASFRSVGTTSVCVSAYNIGRGTGNTSLGCRTFTAAKPKGRLDSAAATGRDVAIRGWALHPDVPSESLAVAVEYSGAAAGIVTGVAAAPRNDIAAAYPGAGPNHGVALNVRLPKAGTYQLCLVSNQVGSGKARVTFGCKSVNVS